MNLNELESDRLQLLLNDQLLQSVLFKVFNYTTEQNRPKVNDNETNVVLGEKYRAYELSKQIIKDAFLEMEKYRQASTTTTNTNRAR